MATGVLVIEDHDLYRDGLRTLLGTDPELALLGEAGTAEDGLELFAHLRPDLVLMDLKLPGLGGVEATRRLLELDLEARVLVLTMFDDDASVFAAMQAGARGYVLKGAKREELLRAVHAVAAGEAVFSAPIAARMMRYFARPVPGWGHVFSELTEREHEVLALLAQRFSTGEIARRLTLRPKTVRNHISSIVAKLQVSSRAEAAERARDRGL